MAEAIIDGLGSGYLMKINQDGSLNISGTFNVTLQSDPDRAFKLEYIVSGTSTGVTGSSIGSIIRYEGAGSLVQVLTWSNKLVTNIGSWV